MLKYYILKNFLVKNLWLSSETVLFVTRVSPEATRDHFIKELLVWFPKLSKLSPDTPAPGNCSEDITLIPCTPIAKWLLDGKVIAPADNFFLVPTSSVPHEVCERSQAHGRAVKDGELSQCWLSLEEWPRASLPIMTANDGD